MVYSASWLSIEQVCKFIGILKHKTQGWNKIHICSKWYLFLKRYLPAAHYIGGSSNALSLLKYGLDLAYTYAAHFAKVAGITENNGLGLMAQHVNALIELIDMTIWASPHQ